jgi:hypothetical protein
MAGKKMGYQLSISLSVAILALSLSACANNSEPLSPSFGDAIHQNSAKQIVNPNPVTPSEDATAMDGRKVVLGVDAYRTGTVDKLKKVSTQKSTK